MGKRILTTSILNVRVSAVNKAQALAWIEKWIMKGAKKLVVTPNPEQVVYAQKDRSFREILNGASLALADGVGLLWASKIFPARGELKERVTGGEVMQELLKMATVKGWRVFLLGGAPGVAEKAARMIRNKKPRQRTGRQETSNKDQESEVRNKSFKIVSSAGVRDIRGETREERKRIIEEINEFKPNLLFVAFGAPWQEKWLAKNLDKLNVKVAMVVGGAFDMIVDPTLKPPRFMTKVGLDWVFRLLRQPWRFRRQLALVKFVSLVLRERFGTSYFES